MKRDNLQTVIEIFTNRGFNVSIDNFHLIIRDDKTLYDYFSIEYINTHSHIDDLIIEISAHINHERNKKENTFVKNLISKRVGEHVNEYLHTEKREYWIVLPPCKCSRYELLKEQFDRYRTVKFTFLDMFEEGAFQSIKYKIENK